MTNDLPKLRIVKPHAKVLTPETWLVGVTSFIERIGRTSHKSEDRQGMKPAEDFIRRIAFKKGHESIIEHAVVSVLFVGSRSMSHQLVRHRLAAFCQESQRFVNYSKARFDNTMNVIVPPSIGDFKSGTIVQRAGLKVRAFCEERDGSWSGEQEHINPWRISVMPPGVTDGDVIFSDIGKGHKQLLFFHALLTSYEIYLDLCRNDVPAEDAREVLVNGCKTEVATTFNLRQWRHVFSMRCTKHAQWQIRCIMQSALRTFLNHPELRVFFEDQEHLLETT